MGFIPRPVDITTRAHVAVRDEPPFCVSRRLESASRRGRRGAHAERAQIKLSYKPHSGLPILGILALTLAPFFLPFALILSAPGLPSDD